MIKPNKHTIDQRQRLVANPPRLSLPPIRQNAPAKILGVRKSTDRILISGQPPLLEPHIVVGEQKHISAELRHRPVPGMCQSLLALCHAADRQAFPKRFQHFRRGISAVVINDENFDQLRFNTFL